MSHQKFLDYVGGIQRTKPMRMFYLPPWKYMQESIEILDLLDERFVPPSRENPCCTSCEMRAKIVGIKI